MTRFLTVITLLFATPMLAACVYAQSDYLTASPAQKLSEAEKRCKIINGKIVYYGIFWVHNSSKFAEWTPEFSSMNECKSVAPAVFAFDLNRPKEGRSVKTLTNPSDIALYKRGEAIIADIRSRNLERRCAEAGYKPDTDRMVDCKFNLANNDRAMDAARGAEYRAKERARSADMNKTITDILNKN